MQLQEEGSPSMQQRLAGRILGSSSAKDNSNSSSRGPQQPTIRHLDDGDDEDDAVSGCMCVGERAGRVLNIVFLAVAVAELVAEEGRLLAGWICWEVCMHRLHQARGLAATPPACLSGCRLGTEAASCISLRWLMLHDCVGTGHTGPHAFHGPPCWASPLRYRCCLHHSAHQRAYFLE